ncbi:Hsp20/alpha crystallin family protein [Skermanella mucosa]|uniref:Hsp20/alpha crystallin family protein n=1 Tax=Skermanella mucosa TaxID=1789672 RepID=UPI00192BCA26|nr:Hsp20/alpha crystallin family protein [Skermanella mucosa]UEM20876.1 Hsp20/alpha crystallin family protein [Skermanella mucosa]
MTSILDKSAGTSEAQPPVTGNKGAAERAGHPLLSLRDEIDRLFDDFSAGMMRSPFRTRLMDFEPFRRFETVFSGAVPTAEVAEKEKEYVVTLELPGIDQKDVEISVSGGMLTVKGEKREEKEKTEKQLHLSERRYGSFQRSFPVPETVDQDRIAAAMKDGVLTVTLPKTEEASRPARKIEVSGP